MAPMTCISLECVLMHMDAALRFKFRAGCPSIRFIEKTTPIQVDYCYFEPCVFHINQTIFKLGVVKQYPPEWAPELKEHPDGVQEDYDVFPKREGKWIETEEEKKTRMECEEALAVLEGIPKSELTLKHIKTLKDELRKIYFRQNPLCHLQLTIISGDYRETEILEYTKSIHDAMRYFMAKVFGGNCDKILVKKMEMETRGAPIPFPSDMKIQVTDLVLSSHTGLLLDCLSPILDGHLQTLEVNEADEISHPVVQSARLLIFNNAMDIPDTWALGHPRVHVRYIFHRTRMPFQQPDGGVALGGRFSLTQGKKQVKKTLQRARNMNGARNGKMVKNGRRCICFAMENELELMVYTHHDPKEGHMVVMESVDPESVILDRPPPPMQPVPHF